MSSLFQNILDLPSSFGMSRLDQSRSSSSQTFAEQQRRWREEAQDFERALNEFFGQHSGNKFDGKEHPRNDAQKMRDFFAQQSLQDQQQQVSSKEREEACRIVDCVRDALSQERPSNQSQEPPVQCPYDQQSRCPYRPESEDVPESSSAPSVWSINPFLRGVRGTPLVGYLDDSPYSPLQLEDRHPFCEHGAKWRRAFADLLAMQHGVDSPCGHERMNREDWMLALPLYLTSLEAPGGSATRQPENDAEEDARIELELYNRFLGAEPPRATISTSTQTFDSESKDVAAPGQPSVISTMTTTQRTTRPDGSVYTHMVLKKRFSDGKEESTETEHTTHGAPRSHMSKQVPDEPKDKPTPSLGYDGKVKQAIEEKKRNGWFWT